MNNKIRIVLADDHPLVTIGIKHMLSQQSNFEVVAEVHTPDSLVEAITTLRPQVVITDYNMPGPARFGDGIKLITHIRNNYPDIQIVVLTMISSHLIASSLYGLGVAAVLLKSSDLNEITNSIESVLLEKRNSAERRKVGDKDDDLNDRISRLTRKEMEILRYLFAGMGVSEIAARLNRGVTTVSTHKNSAMRKLGAANDHELIMFCVLSGLFTS